MDRARGRLTFANVVSVLALLFALGLGGAWAATELAKNDVRSKHIGKGQVKRKDLGKNAVTSPKIENGTVAGADVDEASLGEVPRAGAARTADAAVAAQSADNAGLLDNLDSTAFAAADRFRFGTGDPTATARQPLLVAGGIEVTTDGDADNDETVGLTNNSGAPIGVQNEADAATGFLASGTANFVYGPAGVRVGTLLVHFDGSPQRGFSLTCGNLTRVSGPAALSCWAFLSPGF
jgi:hypothetical protein